MKPGCFMYNLHVLHKIKFSSGTVFALFAPSNDFPHILVEHETGLVHVHLVYAF
jgi:hypothetical protein